MESASPECEICLNVYGPWRRAKLLECGHTCCSLCLRRMAADRPARNEPGANQSAAPAEMNRNETGASRSEPGRGGRAVRCPWCRHVTALPAGLSVLHLPDDPDKMAGVAAAAPRTPASVFIRMPPGNACYLLPPPGDVDRAGGGRGGRVVPKGRRTGGGTLDRGGPGEGHGLERGIGRGLVGVGQILEERERGVLGLGRQMEDEEVMRRTLWTRVCTVIVVGLGLFFLLCVIIHIITCNSPSFSMIACG